MRMNSPIKYVYFFITAIIISACSQEETASDPPTPEDTASAAQPFDSKLITIATGGSAGVYNIIGTTLGDHYSKVLGINAKTQSTGASVENINLMNQNKVAMGFVLLDTLYQAVNGEGTFPEKITTVNQLATIYTSIVHIATTKKTGIKTLTDLVGKRIAVGDQNSGTEINARALLSAHNISYRDINVDYLGFAEAADALKAGRIDAAFLTSGMPNAALLELAQGNELVLVTIEPENAQQIALEMPYFTPTTIPENTYRNDTAIPAIAILNALIIHAGISENDGYQLTKALFEGLPVLINSHQAAAEISMDKAQSPIIAPLHPGAARYYAEQQ